MSSPTPAVVEADPSRRRVPRRTKAVLGVVGVLVIAFVASLLIRVPYVILKPGPAPNTLGSLDGKKILTVTGTRSYPTSGSLHFTTVSMYGGPGNRPSVFEYLAAQIDSHAQIYKESDLFEPKTTQRQVQQQNEAEMTGSQDAAEVVAAREAGFSVPETIVIAAVSDKVPAHRLLKPKDVITSVNGTRITDSPSLRTQMGKVTPGQNVKLGITRSGKAMTLSVPTTKVDGRAVMGVALDPKAKMPFDVHLSVGDVGGPSAGMMFTLAIYDTITPGALTGGKNIAGTGTVDSTEAVGPIGGIREKVVGARDDGATAFLAPADNCAELKGHVPSGLSVYRVATVDQAIKTVKGIAGGKTAGFARCG